MLIRSGFENARQSARESAQVEGQAPAQQGNTGYDETASRDAGVVDGTGAVRKFGQLDWDPLGDGAAPWSEEFILC